ncbi:DUF1905 domain-containing protein [Shimazuella sp. AN120528]|uniref:DUF1905 domain-containing protein n=1 Tax=Shimazuella soli TaxID=1892854 RepID=UPI001F10EDCC|nr:DUF1905 domain-containing protein [Shimazuella soli]MCH5584856.1 DUF1905 domain-containing protein [Shimazuella soli]
MEFHTTVSSIGDLLIIRLPGEIPVDFRSRKCKGSINETPFTGVILRTDEQPPYIPLSKKTEWKQGDAVRVQLSLVNIGLPKMNVPDQLQKLLKEAETTIDRLPVYERQQLLSTIYEAKTDEIRLIRMKAIVQACLDKE